MKFNGRSGVQLRTPRDLSDLAAYTALKFYLQSPKPASDQVAGDQFVLYMGSRQVLRELGGPGGDGHQVGVGRPCRVPVPLSLPPLQATGDYMGVALRNQKVHWVYRLGEAGPTTLSIDEDIGEQFAAISIDRWEAAPAPPLPGSPTTRQGCMSTPNPFACALRTLQFGHMSVTVEKQMIHETKGDTVAPGAEGLLNLQPSNFVFYVGGYPSNFTVSLAGRAAVPLLSSQPVLLGVWLQSIPLQRAPLGSVLGEAAP